MANLDKWATVLTLLAISAVLCFLFYDRMYCSSEKQRHRRQATQPCHDCVPPPVSTSPASSSTTPSVPIPRPPCLAQIAPDATRIEFYYGMHCAACVGWKHSVWEKFKTEYGSSVSVPIVEVNCGLKENQVALLIGDVPQIPHVVVRRGDNDRCHHALIGDMASCDCSNRFNPVKSHRLGDFVKFLQHQDTNVFHNTSC